MRQELISALFLPLLLVLISAPLAFSLIDQNSLYGIRTQETLASEAAWASANKAAGMAGLTFGLIATVVNTVIIKRSSAPSRRKRLLCLGIGVASMAISATIGVSQA